MSDVNISSVDLRKHVNRCLKTHYYVKKYKIQSKYRLNNEIRSYRSGNERRDSQSERTTATSEDSSKSFEDVEKKQFNRTWIKRTVDGNRVYVHLKTGMSSFFPPRTNDEISYSTRNPCVPKGSSPRNNYNIECARYTIGERDASNAVELLNYRDDTRSKTILLGGSKFNSISRHSSYGNLSFSLSKDDIKKMKVIGQVDNKFITAIGVNNLIVIFDQHAISERILLERLIADNKDGDRLKKHFLNRRLTVDLSENMGLSLCKYDNYFNTVGFKCDYSYGSITIDTIPKFLYKNQNDRELIGITYDVIIKLIEEFKEDLLSRRRITVPYPRTFQNILAGRACRAAIKFGDKLSITDCENLLKHLTECNLPFQCAHGRPSVVPLCVIDQDHLPFTN